MKKFFRTKSIEDHRQATGLQKCLTASDLIFMGIGAIIGAGIFVLTGIAAANDAGPAITISYVICGFACLFSALAYAELAAAIGGTGSAYTYSYVSFGEIIAWVIGWVLILEYTMGATTVAIGWSGYVLDLFKSIGITLPKDLASNPFDGGIINLPAVCIILFLTGILCMGMKESVRFNTFIVLIKLTTIFVFIIVASQNIKLSNWQHFFPYGWNGVINGAALVFFAYIGFDAVSTAAEETINPGRDLPIGIMTSLVICTVIYIVVAGLLTGIVPYTDLNVPSPVANALLLIGHPLAAGLIAAGAIAGLTTVMMVGFYGLTRIFLAISNDHLLPSQWGRIDEKTHTPIRIILSTGFIIATLAGFVPMRRTAELVNIGTLLAFILVCCGVMILRWKRPDLERPFRLPWNPVIPIMGALSCIFLMFHLALVTWICFAIWISIGLVIYFLYGHKHSLLNG